MNDDVWDPIYQRIRSLAKRAVASDDALSELIGLLDEPEELVVITTCNALAQLQERATDALPHLLERLQLWPNWLKPYGIRALGAIAPARFGFVWQLMRLIENGSHEVIDMDSLGDWASCEPQVAAAAVSLLLPKVAADVEDTIFDLEPFDDHINRPLMYRKQLADATALVALGSRDGVIAQALLRMFDADVELDRRHIMALLGRLGVSGHVAIGRIHRAFGASDPELRAACLEAIFAMEAPLGVALPMLLEGLTSSERPLRLAALALEPCLLAQRDDAVLLLLDRLQGQGTSVLQRSMILRLLEMLGADGPVLIAALEALLQSDSLRLRKQAIRGLRRLGHAPTADAGAAYQELYHPKESIRLQAAEVLLQCDAHIVEVYDALWSVLEAQRERFEKAVQRRYDKGVSQSLEAMTHTASLFVTELTSGGLTTPSDEGLKALVPQLRELANSVHEEIESLQGSATSAIPESAAAAEVFGELVSLLQDDEARAHWRGLMEEALF